MNAAANNPYTRGIAEFVSGLEYGAIPREVRERARLLMLDAFGCALYGARLPWCRILQRTLARLDRSAACAVWGTRRRLSAPHAALANGTQVRPAGGRAATAAALPQRQPNYSLRGGGPGKTIKEVEHP